jgi:hypothetical protein
VTSIVDTNARLPRLGTPSDRVVGGGAGAASNLPRAWVTSSWQAQQGARHVDRKGADAFLEAALHLITRRRYGRSGTVTHPSAIANEGICLETGAISTASPARQSGAQRNHP